MLNSYKYGIAIDLGTTTLAAALVQLPTGAILARKGSLNPQRLHGLDVITRLQYAGSSSAKLHELQTLVNSELSRLAEELLAAAGVASGEVERVAIAANPAMTHLLLGLLIDTLSHPPYRPRLTGSHSLRTKELGWRGDIPLYVFPSPGGFVGGDTVAFLYGQGFPEARGQIPEPALFLDLGTNGEIVLLADGKLSATSAAAGPAFEGGSLACGMAALPGAICSVEAHAGRLVTASVNNVQPKGLCGSGVLDTVALLLNEGLLDATGRLLHPAESSSPLSSRLQEIGKELHFVIYRDAKIMLSLSQEDIRQIQLAKGAVRAGTEVLFERAGIAAKDLKKIVLTGSFGASLRFDSLKTVGVLSKSMLKNTGFVREGSLKGVVRLLSPTGSVVQVESLAKMVKVVPLSGTALFERHFMGCLDFSDCSRGLND